MQVQGAVRIPLSLLLEMACSAAATMSDEFTQLQHATKQAQPRTALKTMECTVSKEGKLQIFSSDSLLASTIVSRSGATAVRAADPFSLANALSIAASSDMDHEEHQAVADVGVPDAGDRSGYMHHPAQLDASLSLLMTQAQSNVVIGAEALYLHARSSESELRAMQSGNSLILGTAVRSMSITGLLSESASCLANHSMAGSTFETIWQRLNLETAKAAEPLRLLVISQQGTCLADLFDM